MSKIIPLELHDNKIVRLFRRFGNQPWDCGRPLREQILLAYPTNFTANFEKNLHRLFMATTKNKTCDNVKSVIVGEVSFRVASRCFKNTGPNGTIFNRSKPVFWTSSSIENCSTYVVLISMKHSTENKTQTGFNGAIMHTLIKYILAKDKCERATNTRESCV